MRLRIRHKIFATLLLTSVIVAAGLLFFLQWNFDRGFLNYVKSQELEQLDRLAQQLAGYYRSQNSWEFIVENHPLWQRIHRELGPNMAGRESGPKDLFPEHHAPPPPGGLPPRGSRNLGPRIALFDAKRNWLIGGQPERVRQGDLTTHPISLDGEIIGYLGLIPNSELSHEGDLLFVEQQTESYLLITMAMVVLSLVLAYPVTVHLLRPVNLLAAGTRKLIAGRFGTRIPVNSGDELGRLSEDFNILAKTLEENESSRRRWVADISHELRTPLAVLRGEIEAMQDGIRRPDPETIAALHGEILHLERMVNDLYELSMSDIGALNYKGLTVDPIGILSTTIDLFEKRMVEKGLEIIRELAGAGDCTLVADPDRLQQLFTNLLENCLRYTDGPGKIEVLVAADEKTISFLFQDSAPGVSAEQSARLFDRLYRVEGSRNRATGGAGLGLAICKNIVDAHQGTIEAAPSPHGGVAVTIKLPLTRGS